MWIRNCCNYSKIILIYSLLLTSSASFCGIFQTTKVPTSPQNIQARHLQSSYNRESDWSPIRIEAEFLNYDSSSAEHQNVKVAVDHAIQWYKNVLNIKRLTSTLRIDETFEENEGIPMDIPEKFKTEGVEADYLFFINIINDPNDGRAGWANYYQNDTNTHQPLIGVFQINNVPERELSFDDVLIIAAHEMAHALVFHPELFEHFVDSSGNPYENNPKNDTVRGVEVCKITTPNVVKYARATFGCSDLDGVELESTGPEGTAFAHWDKRIMYGDYMGASIKGMKDFVFSDITLGLFEDSGWYLPNYEYTQQITWGYQQGCSFIEEKCIEDQKPTNDVFCIDDGNYHCDYNRLSKGRCEMENHEETIPDEYSYFGNSSFGGYDIHLDYCPVIRHIPGGNCRGINAVKIELNSDYGEQICENCRCVEGTYSKDNEAHDHVGCHWIECEDDHTIVHIGDEEIKCPEDGGTVVVPNYKGELYCPKWIDVCNPVPCMNTCSGIGICRYGVCECPGGKMGGDCLNIAIDFSYRYPITPREEESVPLDRIDPITTSEEDSGSIISIAITILLILS